MAEVDPVKRRIETLREVNELGEGLLPDTLLTRSRDLADRAAGRLEHGSSHTVVALAGATGSGKSSLFNAVAGQEIARSGVIRPTTATAEAVTFGGEDASDLLDWLQIPSRHRLEDRSLAGLVLLDLPDHDSFQADHRAEVDRLVKVVDVFCWVVDPQKYADAVLHKDYIARFGAHDAVTLVVLNQVDRLSAEERRACIEHLGRLLQDDGLTDARIIATSAVTGEGVDELRSELAARVAERRALVKRIQADLDWVAGDIARTAGTADPTPVTDAQRDRLADALAEVVGARGLASAAGAAVRYRGGSAVGWPFTRWVAKLRPDPLRRLGLAKPKVSVSGDAPRRTNIGGDNPIARAGVTTAVAELTDDVGAGLPAPWKERLRDAARPTDADLVDALDRAVGDAGIEIENPGWWRPVNILQWLLALVAVGGLVWLAVLFVLEWFQIPDPPTPEWHGWPVPTLMVIGGAVLGIVVSIVARRLVAVSARNQERRVRKRLAKRTRMRRLRRSIAALAKGP